MALLPINPVTPKGVAEVTRIVQARQIAEALAPAEPNPDQFPWHIRMSDPAPKVRAKCPVVVKPGTRRVPVDKHHRKRFAAS